MVFKCLLNCIILLIISTTVWAKSSATTVKEGNAFYRQGQYDEALQGYQQALSQGGQERVARYNLGNTLYRKSQVLAEQDIDSGITHMEDAIAAYQTVLDHYPKEEDAAFNVALAKRALEELKKKKQEQEKNKDKNQKDQNNKDQNKDKQEDSQNQEKQNNKDESKQDSSNENNGKSENSKNEEKKNSDPSDAQDKKDAKEDQSKGHDVNKDKQQNKEDKDSKKQEQARDRNVTGVMSQEEAENILEDYERNEEPKGMLNFIEKKKGNEQPVVKDW